MRLENMKKIASGEPLAVYTRPDGRAYVSSPVEGDTQYCVSLSIGGDIPSRVAALKAAIKTIAAAQAAAIWAEISALKAVAQAAAGGAKPIRTVYVRIGYSPYSGLRPEYEEYSGSGIPANGRKFLPLAHANSAWINKEASRLLMDAIW